MSFLIGIDIGTTHTKAVAFDLTGAVLISEELSYPAIKEVPGHHELDPDVLLDAVKTVLKRAIGGIGKKDGDNAAMGTGDRSQGPGLAGIAFSCAMHSLLAVDQLGRPMSRVLTWADLRSSGQAAALKASPAGEQICRNTGTPIHPMSPLCKLIWWQTGDPAVFAAASHFISIKEYIWWHLFGVYEVDHSIASATGLFDIYKLEWYGPALAAAGIGPDRLSGPVPTRTIRRLGKEAAGELGLPEGLPFIIGASDGCLANLGSLAISEGETALTIGTSGAIRMTTKAPAKDSEQRLFNYILMEDLYVSGGATNNGGNVLEWFVRQFPAPAGASDDVSSIGTADSFSARIAGIKGIIPGCDGLVFLPYLNGERAPIWDAAARGMFFGIRPQHTNLHFLRAVMEGISYALYQIGSSLEEVVGPVRRIYASGGFIQSPEWLQLMADIFDREVLVTNAADASAIGAVLLGFMALGLIEGPGAAAGMIRVLQRYTPDATRHALYEENIATFNALYPRLRDLM